MNNGSVLRLIILALCISLSGCARYTDIHGHSKALNEKVLSKSHVYSQSHYPVSAEKTIPAPDVSGFWFVFQNPQLNQLESVALADSPSIKIAANRVDIARHLAQIERATLWPSLDLTGYYQRVKFPVNGLVPPPFNGSSFNIGNLALNFNYELDFWGKNRAAFQAKMGEALATQEDHAEAKLILAAHVAATYFELCNDIQQIHLAQANYQLQKQNLKIVTDRLQHGIRSDIPMKTVTADVESAEQTVSQFKEKSALAEQQLAVFLGDNPLNTHIATRAVNKQFVLAKLPASLPAHLLANRPDILAAKWRVEAAAKEAKVAKAGFFPDINLNVLAGYQSALLHLLFQSNNQNYTATSSVDLPIFDAGKLRANLKTRYAEYDEAVNQYNQTIIKALGEVANQLTILRAVKTELNAQNVSLKAIETSYQLYLAQYHHGIIDYQHLTQIKANLLMQKARVANLKMDQLQATSALLAALGGQDG